MYYVAKFWFQLKLEKVKLEESIKYLQNTCQKLYNDFNASKASEMVEL